ncbi:MAG: chorismate synthase [Acidimicrobiales bacterium]|nr:chorismate synthase [Acidimicrobiales bacterium]
MSSVYGNLFRISTFGESHGPAIGVILDGCPPGIRIDQAAIQADLDRRRPGQSRLVTQRQEGDEVEILSGVFEGHSTGTPIAMLVRNADHKPGAYDHLKDVFRPSHADYSYLAKYGRRDHRGGGRSSARETIGRVATGAIARRFLTDTFGTEVIAWVDRIHTIEATVDSNTVTIDDVESSPTRCPDPDAAAAMVSAIDDARGRGDSLGGVVGFAARGVPPGWGEPVFDRLEADLAKGIMSLPACKGFEIGSGFGGTLMTGLEHNDPYVPGADGPELASNRSGGVQGGISVGAPIYGRAAFKPTATIASEQTTVTTDIEATTLAARGRHDPCVLPRAVPMVEAMILLTLADHALRQRALAGPN